MGALRDELLELLGTEPLELLARARGGQRVYIPKAPRDLHWLVLAIGREGADALAWRYGGCRIELPRSRSQSRAERIRLRRARGESVADIALCEGLSERHVYRILSD